MTPSAGSSEDHFHTPPSNDVHWTETAWFGFSLPERRIAGAIYPVFRSNLGICSCTVAVWDDESESPWEVPYYRSHWHLPAPDHQLTDLSLPNGLSYQCLEPLSRYRVRYCDGDGDEIDIDFLFEGLREPNVLIVSADVGHLDQIGRVTGTLRLHGKEMPIDCLEMRDRSWSIRPDEGQVRAGYSYGTASVDLGFHAMTRLEAGSVEERVVGGYLLREGTSAKLESGTRQVVREDGKPVTVLVEGRDALGREFRADGVCLNRFAFQPTPNHNSWISLTRWKIDGAEAFGQDQDVWSPDLMRAARLKT